MLAMTINYEIPADPVPHPHPPERAGRMGKADPQRRWQKEEGNC